MRECHVSGEASRAHAAKHSANALPRRKGPSATLLAANASSEAIMGARVPSTKGARAASNDALLYTSDT
jgi:hypothetical protein